MAGRSKDISLSGMRLWVPNRPSTSQVCVHLHSVAQATDEEGEAENE